MRRLRVTKRAGDSRFLKRYLEEIHDRPLLTVEEEQELALRARKGDEEALRRLVEGNLRFVVMVAKEYKDSGLPLADLINEGNVGLIEAAKRFDVTRGVKFISYAVWWIRQSILQALAKYNRTVRIPINHVWALNRVSKVSSKLEQQLGRDPSLEEIASEMDTDATVLRANLSRFHSRRDLSLDQPMDNSSNLLLGDRLGDPDALSPDDALTRQAFEEELNAVLNTLEPREAQILRMFFGLGFERPYTLGEIGEELGLSRERVRQLKNRALRKLQHTSRRDRLRPFLGAA
ncbi:MAG: RNA polymerase sigma factor RpoD/SigA [Calditrichaeota bacterium]|nr:RNA polymerase sigma factor RpoD/SigA [Calditrichota bacterium]